MQVFNRSSIALVILLSLCIMQNSMAEDATPSIERGAHVYVERCALCHGEKGMGEGIIPLKIKNYPNTNLFQDIKVATREGIHRVVSLGAKDAAISEFMPPMGDELTWTELESVVEFLLFLRDDTVKAIGLVKSAQSTNTASIKEGLTIFETRCALCHGENGEGDGRMAKIIKTPPPFDLSASRMPESYLAQIIKTGGEGVGRSKQMPPWGDQLSAMQIDSVIMYIKTLRD